MRLAVPKESHPRERRVAATPDSVRKLVALGFDVAVEAGCGAGACLPDAAYSAAGARLEADPVRLYADADLLLKVRPLHDRPDLGRHEGDLLRTGATVVSFVWPAGAHALLDRLAQRGITLFSMDQIPRITRAQKMDALSSMANIAGYRAVIEAAHQFGSFFTGQITAAGKIAPAKVLVIGAGVAGLAALGAAKGMGAVVRAFDTRAAVRDQVKSMGAEFLEVTVTEDGEGGGGYAREMSPAFIAAEMALFRAQAREVDIVITTALIPGRPAPKLWLADMVEAMKPGSVVVDLAAEAGGNCELTVPDEAVVRHGVTIVGFTDLTSRLATTASQLYAQNLVHLLTDFGGAQAMDADARDFRLNGDDDVVRGGLVLRRGELVWPPAARPAPSPESAPASTSPAATGAGSFPAASPAAPALTSKLGVPTIQVVDEVPASARLARDTSSARQSPLTWAMVGLTVVAWLALHYAAGHTGEDPSKATALFLERFTVFVLACFVGWQVVWNVTPALHTPLMSVTNAISGIILLGGILHTNGPPGAAPVVLGVVAVWLATINVAGGFLVTRRMLRMFRK
ncbi:MAG: Re/Si-specific NAD(P)(+) transhydrogenase subunit alpha [Myxococcales bacterium]|nr:Re/Si-specific NAD(P)(+) transhydrogenase subunit alpha [Myxococcales bacterium]